MQRTVTHLLKKKTIKEDKYTLIRPYGSASGIVNDFHTSFPR